MGVEDVALEAVVGERVRATVWPKDRVVVGITKRVGVNVTMGPSDVRVDSKWVSPLVFVLQ